MLLVSALLPRDTCCLLVCSLLLAAGLRSLGRVHWSVFESNEPASRSYISRLVQLRLRPCVCVRKSPARLWLLPIVPSPRQWRVRGGTHAG